MLRAAKWLAIVSGVLPLLVAAALAALLFSESAAKLTLRIAANVVEGLQTDSVSGRLSGPLHLRGLRYRSESIDIDLGSLRLDWRLSTLMTGEIFIEELVLDDLSITSHGSAVEPEPTPAFELPEVLPVPLLVRIKRAQLNRLKFYPPDQEAPFVIDEALLQGQINSQEVAIAQLSVSSPLFDLEGSARSQLWKNYKTTAALSWNVWPSEALAIEGSFSANGNRARLNYKVHAEAQTSEFGNYLLDTVGQANEKTVSFDNVSITSPDSDLAVSGNGLVGIGATEPEWDVQLDWVALQWPPVTAALTNSTTTADYMIRSQEGHVSITGTPANYQADLRAGVSTPDAPTGALILSAAGNTQSINLHTIEMRALKGVADGSATVNWRDEISSQFEFSGSGVDPGELFAQWPGELDFVLRGEQSGNTLTVQTAQLAGVLRDYPVQLAANAHYDGVQVSIPEFRLQSGGNTVDGHGELGSDSLDFEWHLDSPTLQAFHPDLSGSVISEGRLRGALPWPKVQATATASKLRFRQYALLALDLDADVDLTETDPSAPSTLQLSATKLELAETGIAQVQLSIDGILRQHTISLQIDAEPADVQAELSGAFADESWRGSLISADVVPVEVPAWNLESPHALLVTAQEQKIDRACWKSEGARFCFDAHRIHDLLQGNVELREFDFQTLKAFWPEDMDLRGYVSGTAELTQPVLGQWQLQGKIDTSATSLLNRNAESNSFSEVLALKPGTIKLGGDNQALNAQLEFPFVGGGGVSGDFSLQTQAESLSAGALGGDLQVELPALDFLSALSPELQQIEGTGKIDLQLAGTLQAPKPVGTLEIKNAEFELASPGLTVSAINLIVQGDSSGRVTYSGSAVSGDGSLELTGQSLLRPVKGSDSAQESSLSLEETSITITGDEFQLWNASDARLWVSPDISMELLDNTLEIEGVVVVPRAQITPMELPQSAVSVSPDQVIVPEGGTIDDVASAESDALKIRSKVKVVLGDAVEIKGFGFQGRLQGELAVKQLPNKPVVASGELNILDGEYRAYGQGLVIDRGKILFAGGAIDNPGINVRAQRRPADGVVVGVNVRGELKKPELTIFSEPSMSSSNQLSWLVLGRRFDNTSDAESDYIAQAALLLGVHGGDYLAKGLGKNLGLDTIGIETGSGEAGAASDVNQAALVVGKYLTPKLYISYGVGLLESISTVKLRYIVTEHWNLETESSAISSGGDVHYSFEN